MFSVIPREVCSDQWIGTSHQQEIELFKNEIKVFFLLVYTYLFFTYMLNCYDINAS